MDQSETAEQGQQEQGAMGEDSQVGHFFNWSGVDPDNGGGPVDEGGHEVGVLHHQGPGQAGHVRGHEAVQRLLQPEAESLAALAERVHPAHPVEANPGSRVGRSDLMIGQHRDQGHRGPQALPPVLLRAGRHEEVPLLRRRVPDLPQDQEHRHGEGRAYFPSSL